MKKVNILGTKYKVTKLEHVDDYMHENRYEAYITYDKKSITLSPNADEQTFIHEFVHGYLYEIGKGSWNNEDDVEFITKMIVKLNRELTKGVMK